MITIEASNIYFRGGFVLLEQIIEYCEQNCIEAKVYIGYSEVFEYLTKKDFSYISIVKTKGWSTIFRYFIKRKHILFFCNLPPFVRCSKSVLYAHNILFFQSPKAIRGNSNLFNLKKFVYYYWIKYFAEKVDIVACQTEAVQNSLRNNLQVNSELFPFYRKASPQNLKKEFEFCYIGAATPHKNNKRLLEAVDQLSEKFHFQIIMTIEDNVKYKDLIKKINSVNARHGRIIILNKGLVPYSEVVKIYSESQALIFPSLAETIALPIIEGLQNGLKILSSDLEFTHQIVENPIIFNPLSVDEIKSVMENYLTGKYQHIVQRNKISNKLPELINCLR